MSGRQLLVAGKILSKEIEILKISPPSGLEGFSQLANSSFYANFLIWQRAVIVAKAKEGVEEAAKQFINENV